MNKKLENSKEYALVPGEHLLVHSSHVNRPQIEAHYSKMIEEIEDYSIILLDKDGIILNWNKGAEKIKGFTKQEIIGKSFELFYPADDRKKGLPQRLIKQASEKGKAATQGWRLRKQGNKFWASVVITALRDEQENLIGFSKVTRDLTAKKRADDKLREYSKMLKFQNSELEKFAYATSHDLKEPLRKIHLYTTYVLENGANALDERSREYLGRSVAAINRMTLLIDDVLSYSKTTSHVENLSEVDLNEIVRQAIAHITEDPHQEKITAHVAKLPVIQAVPFQCRQLFDNLIINAIKYRHPQRESTITISADLVTGAEIKHRKAEPARQYHLINVTDNGMGFEPEQNDKVLEIFQRLHQQPDSKGSGVGLAICKKIMQNHNGFITAEGRPDEGATFKLFFPVQALAAY